MKKKRLNLSNEFKVKSWKQLTELSFLNSAIRPLIDKWDDFGLSSYFVRILPHKQVEAAYHKKASEVIFIVKGNGKLIVGKRVSPLRPKDAILLKPFVPHGFVAGAKGMEMISFLSSTVNSTTDFFSVDGHHVERPRVVSGR